LTTLHSRAFYASHTLDGETQSMSLDVCDRKTGVIVAGETLIADVRQRKTRLLTTGILRLQWVQQATISVNSNSIPHPQLTVCI